MSCPKYKRQINMSKPLFLLGAGFNYDAKKVAGTIAGESFYCGKYHIDCGYPLLSDLYKICFPGKENDLSRSIEELFDESIKKRNYEPVRHLYDKIMEADYYLITRLNQTPSNCYTTFFNKFKESSFLTFNYDSLAELFLLKLGQWYPHDGYGVPVETPLNWSIENDDKKKMEYLKKSSTSLVLHLHGTLCIYIKDFEIHNNLIELKQNPAFNFDPNSIAALFYPYEKAPFDLSYSPRIEERVIAPVPDKTEGLKNDFIQRIYLKGSELLKTSKILVVIGYNFAVHDKRLIISPNATELEARLAREYPNIKWRSLSTSFRNWVDSDFAKL
jgi:hypothetical protein